MTGKTFEERIDALDPDQINWNDAGAYAAMGVGVDDDDESGLEQEEVDTTAETTPPASAPAAAAPAPAPAASSPAAAPAPTDPTAQVDGIATADGKRIIPYAVLQATRRELAETNNRLAEAQAALEAAKKAPAGDNSLSDRAADDPNSLTDEEMAELEQDFPALAKPLKMVRDASAKLQQLAATPSAAPAAPAPAPSPRAAELDSDEAFDAGIVANPLLASWMGSNGREWQRAQAVDRLLMQDPANQSLTYTERFAKVQRMVAAEFEIAVPARAAPAPAPTPAPAAAAPAAPAFKPKPAALPSLSDLGGTTPQSEEDAVNGRTTTDLLASAERMTDAELMRMAGLSY
jgi:hypothetical protein